ncbi:MAG: hypothetical protein KAY24_01020 [Candidatus Eisenbacteria sp.]|nr:hypothetical protein [Candidatus Eisenbacteria bacterium]
MCEGVYYVNHDLFFQVRDKTITPNDLMVILFVVEHQNAFTEHGVSVQDFTATTTALSAGEFISSIRTLVRRGYLIKIHGRYFKNARVVAPAWVGHRGVQ